MTLTKRAWRFSTDLSATLIPLISLISSPGCSVPKIKKTNKLVSFMLGWLSTTSNVFMQAMGRIDALVGFFHSSAFTNLFRVGFSELAPYADRVCLFSTLLREVFFLPGRPVFLAQQQLLIWSIVIRFLISLNCRALLRGWSYQLLLTSQDLGE